MRDAILNLSRIVPTLLVDPDRQAPIRFTAAKGHAECIAEVRQPLRSAAVGRDSKTGAFVHAHVDRRGSTVERIWLMGGIESCVWAQL